MKSLIVTLCLLASASACASEFRLEGYQQEVNDGTVIREASALRDVVAVRFHSCRVSDASLSHVSRWPGLRGVYLHDTAITGTGLLHLKHHAELKQVTLFGPNVNDGGIAALKQLPHVTHLQVGNGYRWDGLLYTPQVTDRSLETIGQMTGVRYLSIDNADVSDEGLLHLATLRQARQIQFFRCSGITSGGIDRLRGLLPGCRITLHVTEPDTDDGRQ